MTLNEYWREYRATWAAPEGIAQMPTSLTPFIAAGFKAGLTPEQLLRFHTQYLRINQVVRTLTPEYQITADKVQEIMDAYSSGLIYPKDVIRRLFAPEEVHVSFRESIFGCAGNA